jgi:hypothetical protein
MILLRCAEFLKVLCVLEAFVICLGEYDSQFKAAIDSMNRQSEDATDDDFDMPLASRISEQQSPASQPSTIKTKDGAMGEWLFLEDFSPQIRNHLQHRREELVE